MDAFEEDSIAPDLDEYIGNDLTWDDLKNGFSAFVEDELSEDRQMVSGGV
jgi:hypothetical protein